MKFSLVFYIVIRQSNCKLFQYKEEKVKIVVVVVVVVVIIIIIIINRTSFV